MNKVMETAEVIVIGAGLTGCSAAYYLAKKGVKVLVLESDEIGHGASCRNGGGVRQSARDPKELPIALYAVRNIWPNLSEELGTDVEYVQQGNLRLGKTEAHRKTLQARTDSCVAAGLDVRMIDAYEIHQLCPCLAEDVVTASICPTDGHANPLRTTLGFYMAARRLGVHFITGEKVIRLNRIKGRVRQAVTAAGNVYEADKILVAAEVWSRPILNTVGIDIPMFKRIDHSIVTEPVPFLFNQMLGTAEGHFHGRQSEHGSLTFGDHTGLEIEHKNWTDVPEVQTTFAGVACRDVLDYIPFLKNVKLIRAWSGWQDMTPDELPVIDEIDELPGLYTACGFSGHGFALAPAVGKIMSEMMLGEETCVDVTELNYRRFDGRAKLNS